MFSLLQNLTLPYVSLNETQSKTEESIFKATSILLINETNKRNKKNKKDSYNQNAISTTNTNTTNYKKHTNPPIEINISVPVTIHNTSLLYYQEFKYWFVKRNFKYTFYKCTPYSPTNFYIDSIHINNFYTSNDIAEAPINNIVFTHPLVNHLIKPILYYFSQLFYSKTKKIYITIQFIVREP
jgi:hypothetical protein